MGFSAILGDLLTRFLFFVCVFKRPNLFEQVGSYKSFDHKKIGGRFRFFKKRVYATRSSSLQELCQKIVEAFFNNIILTFANISEIQVKFKPYHSDDFLYLRLQKKWINHVRTCSFTVVYCRPSFIPLCSYNVLALVVVAVFLLFP